MLDRIQEDSHYRERLRDLILTKTLINLPERFEAFAAKQQKFNTQLEHRSAKTEQLLKEFSQRLNKFEHKFNNFIDNLFNEFVKYCTTKFEQSNQRIDNLEQHIDEFIKNQQQLNKEHQQQFIKLEQRIDQLEQRFDKFVKEQQQFNQEQRQFVKEQQQFNQEQRQFVKEQRQFNQEQRQFNQDILQRVETLEKRVDMLIQRFDEFEKRFDEFVANQEATNKRLEQRANRVEQDSAWIKSKLTELEMHRKLTIIPATINSDLEVVRTLTVDDLRKMLKKAHPGVAIKGDLLSFANADMVLEVIDTENNTQFFAIEVSYTADERDTYRSIRNAKYLTEFTGQPAHPVVASIRNDHNIQHLIDDGTVHWYKIEDTVPRINTSISI